MPGEDDAFPGIREELPSAAITGYIASVDHRRGMIGVNLGVGMGHRPDVKLPMGQFSFRLDESSWFRFMPQVGDVVTLVQNLNGKMHILNYEAINYQQLADADAADQYMLRLLEPGEFEIRSRGTASIFGSRYGTLRLGGGSSTITLSRDQQEIVQDATLNKVSSLASEQRFGEVRRRLLPTDPGETALAGGILREYKLHVARDILAAETAMVDVAAGDVLDETTVTPAISDGGSPVRYQVKVYDATGQIEVFGLEVDATGNVQWDQAETAVGLGLKMTGLLSSLLAQYRDITLQPTTTIKLGGPGAIEPLVLGTQLTLFLGTLLGTLSALVTALGLDAAASPATLPATNVGAPAAIAGLTTLLATLASTTMLSSVAYTQKLSTPGV